MPFTEMIKSAQNIIYTVGEKLKVENNPLFFRIQLVLNELKGTLLAIKSSSNAEKEKNYWSIIYRDGDMLDEMAKMLKNTTPVPIEKDVEYIKQSLVLLTEHVVQKYGKQEAKYIITPKFKELAKMD
jgi:hypothetical protein